MMMIFEMLSFLLAAGADVTARNEYDELPDDLTKDKEIRRVLIKAGTYR